MIVDYNYIPHVQGITQQGTFSITPRSPKNKGFIYVIGCGDFEGDTDVMPSSIVFPSPTGSDVTVTTVSNFITGSFMDMFMQFKKFPDSAVTTFTQTSDINFLTNLAAFGGTNRTTAMFVPITYKKLNFVTTSSTFLVNPILITLY